MILQNFSDSIRNFVYVESSSGEELFFINYLNPQDDQLSHAKSSHIFQEESLIRLEQGRSNIGKEKDFKRSSFFKNKKSEKKHFKKEPGLRNSMFQSQFEKLNLFQEEDDNHKFFTRKNFFNFNKKYQGKQKRKLTKEKEEDHDKFLFFLENIKELLQNENPKNLFELFYKFNMKLDHTMFSYELIRLLQEIGFDFPSEM
jgi:hypothetical protein